jgi:hypothetical protein
MVHLSVSHTGPNTDVICSDAVTLAAPQVAGVVATYLSHPETNKKWDGLKGIKRVEAIQKYLISDESSWVKNQNKDELGNPIRVIWNGAKEEDHRSSGANGYSNPAAPAPTPPPAAPKTKALSIILQKSSTIKSTKPAKVDIFWSWRYFATDQGVAKLCDLGAPSHDEPLEDDPRPKDNSSPSLTGDNKPPPYLTGDVKIKNLHGRDCRYKNDGTGNPGMLWCKEEEGLEVGISCQADNMKDTAKDLKPCQESVKPGEAEISQQAVVICEW